MLNLLIRNVLSSKLLDVRGFDKSSVVLVEIVEEIVEENWSFDPFHVKFFHNFFREIQLAVLICLQLALACNVILHRERDRLARLRVVNRGNDSK